MATKFNMQGWLRKQWQKDQDIKAEGKLTEDTLNEEYIEIMRDLEEGLMLIKDGWLEWKKGPMTEKEDIKPAQKELMNYIIRWMKKNIK
tara:strand:+ start:82 stop:348 length:267 start_codon:yes stop_codon:yes gene_type:complete